MYEVPFVEVLKEALVVEKLGKVLVEQFTPTDVVVAAFNPATNSFEAHWVVEIFEELNAEEVSDEHTTFSLPLVSVVNAETLSEPEQVIVVPRVKPITPLGRVTLKLEPSYPKVPPLMLLK